MIRRHWFLIVLISCLVLGFKFAEPLQILVALAWLKWAIVAVTMVAMTWPLRTEALVQTVRKPLPALIAIAVNLILAPLVAWPLSFLLTDSLSAGLVLAAAVPSTLASAAVWTRRAGGNDSICLLVTVITNSLCFVVTPLWVFWLTRLPMTGLDVTAIITSLLCFVVVPMGIGQGLRLIPGSGQWATDRKPVFSLIAQIGILAMVLLLSLIHI